MAKIFSFSNSIVVVTGAASGIGRLMALGAATRGAAAVVLWDVNEKALASVSAEIEARGVKAHPFVVDISDRASVMATAKKVLASAGVPDVVINNAGVISGKRFLDLTESDITKTYAVNTLALYWTLQALAVSRSQRNTADEFVQFLTWSVESERLAGPIVELVDHRLDRVVRDAVEVGALRVVVANETVQILVRSALPGRVWVAEKYGASRRDCELAMPRHFLSLIPGQSLPELFGEAHDLVPENVDHGGRVAGARKSSY